MCTTVGHVCQHMYLPTKPYNLTKCRMPKSVYILPAQPHNVLPKCKATLWGVSLLSLSDHQSAAAQLTVEDVTPSVTPAGTLPPRESAIVDVFANTTNSVVNVLDVTLQGRVAGGPEVDVPEGNGTGFVWDKQGYIVTNWHVLQASLGPARDPSSAVGRQVAVVSVQSTGNKLRSFPGNCRSLLSGTCQVESLAYALDSSLLVWPWTTVESAKLVGADKLRDLAVLRIDAPPDLLEPVQLGSSGKLRVGQQCLAIGNPFGFDHTLTTGVISGVNRDIRSQITGMVIPGGIQTDAAINPGNSGGPLLDSTGRIIGINTQIFTATGTSAGLGFALPIDMVKTVVPQIIQNGKVIQPSLNVQFATGAKLGVKTGLVIQSVDPDGAAARGGLLPTRRTLTGLVPGDAILAIDDAPVRNNGDVLAALDRHQVGDQVQVKVQRFGEPQGPKELVLTVTLQEDR